MEGGFNNYNILEQSKMLTVFRKTILNIVAYLLRTKYKGKL